MKSAQTVSSPLTTTLLPYPTINSGISSFLLTICNITQSINNAHSHDDNTNTLTHFAISSRFRTFIIRRTHLPTHTHLNLHALFDWNFVFARVLINYYYSLPLVVAVLFVLSSRQSIWRHNNPNHTHTHTHLHLCIHLWTQQHGDKQHLSFLLMSLTDLISW